MSERAIHFWVTGRVQGVSFRASTQHTAQRLGLVGWVKNLDDGRVEGVASGAEAQIEDLEKWLKKGPVFARVDDLYIEDADKLNTSNFEVQY